MRHITNPIIKLLFLVSAITFSQEKKENPFSFEWDNGFKIESADKNFKLKFGGRIMVDHAIFSQDDDLGELTTKSGTEFRRSRFYTSGTVYGNVDFKLQIDFASGSVVLKDAYLGIKKVPILGNIRVGHVKEPFRFDALTSSKYITFMERALPVDFMQVRNNGIIFINDFLKKKLSIQAGYFRNEDNNSSDKIANDGYALTARATTLALNEKEKSQFLHLGVGHSFRNPDSKEYEITSRPEAHLSGEKYISTGTISNVSNANLTNFEAAYNTGSFLLQSEYLIASVETESEDLDFSSFYLQASYFLTGESKKYKSSYAAFDRVKPNKNFGKENNGTGAWEVALRYSKSDLNSESILGGEQSDITLGLNWYLNPVTRIMLNHVWVDIKDVGNATNFQIRFQIDF